MKILSQLLQRELHISYYAYFCHFSVFGQNCVIFHDVDDKNFWAEMIERHPSLYTKLINLLGSSVECGVIYCLDDSVKVCEIMRLLRKILYYSSQFSYGECKTLLINMDLIDVYGSKQQLQKFEKKLAIKKEIERKELFKCINVNSLVELIQEY